MCFTLDELLWLLEEHTAEIFARTVVVSKSHRLPKETAQSLAQTKEPKTPETPQADTNAGSIWTPGFLSDMGSGSSQEDISEGSGVKNDALLD